MPPLRSLRPLFATLIVAVAAQGGHAQDARPDPVTEELARITLDATGDRFDAALFALSRRPDAASTFLRLATDRFGTTSEEPTAWLCEALSTVLQQGWPASAGDALPTDPPPGDDASQDPQLRDLRAAIDAIELITGRKLPACRPVPRDPRGKFDFERGSRDASLEERVGALLELSRDLGVPSARVVPWLTWAVDHERVPSPLRVAAADALVAQDPTVDPGRLIRFATDVTRPYGGPVEEALGILARTRRPEIVTFLMQVAEERTRVAGGWSIGNRCLEHIEREDPGAYARGLEGAFDVVRSFEAESAPLRHSTGVAVEGGLSAKRGRDHAQHMVYGPYVTDLPTKGGLHVRFRFRVDGVADVPPDARILQLEVTSPEMERQSWPVQRRPVRRDEVELGAWTERLMLFHTHPQSARMEFRVFWDGKCDVVVDRIEVLRTRDADPSLVPPRAGEPRRAPVKGSWHLRETSDALFDAASDSSGGLYAALRSLLLERNPGVAEADRNGNEPGDRAWLADVLRKRRRRPQEFERLTEALDRAMQRVEGAISVNHFVEPRPEPPVWHTALVEGTCALRIAGRDVGKREGVRDWIDDRTARSTSMFNQPIEHPAPLLPASDLWPAVFAEVWLTAERRSFPDTFDEVPPPPDPNDPMAPVPAARATSYPSTVGPRRLHALQWLAWLGDKRARPALVALRDDADATDAERRVATFRLADLDRAK